MRVAPLKMVLVALSAAFLYPSFAFDVSADSAVIMDAQTGKILWSKDPDTARYPASTTKIMTAMLLIEHCAPDEMITAPPGIDTIGGASLHLAPGEQVTANEMLYAIMLRSANDACVAVADHISGSVPEFVKLMNERAQQIGCTNTHFDNPNGLNDDEHKISARDLALVAREAMKYSQFRDVVGQRRHTLVRSVNTQDRFLVNHDKYLAIDPSADGIKTGWTIPAGYCYVGSATRSGYRLITVVLHSTNWKADNAAMLDWGFSNCERKTLAKPGESMGDVPVKDGAKGKLVATVQEPICQAYLKDQPSGVHIVATARPDLKAPVVRGEEIGSVQVSDDQGWTQTLPLIASTSIPKSDSRGGPGWWLVIGGIGFGAWLIRRRTTKSSSFSRAYQRLKA